MKVHMESHHEIRCNICDYKCLNKLGLENHMEKKHMTLYCVKSSDVATSQLVNNCECKSFVICVILFVKQKISWRTTCVESQ